MTALLLTMIPVSLKSMEMTAGLPPAHEQLTIAAADHLVVWCVWTLAVGRLGTNSSHDRLTLEVVHVRLWWVGGLGAAGLEHIVDVEVIGILDRRLNGRTTGVVAT